MNPFVYNLFELLGDSFEPVPCRPTLTDRTKLAVIGEARSPWHNRRNTFMGGAKAVPGSYKSSLLVTTFGWGGRFRQRNAWCWLEATLYSWHGSCFETRVFSQYDGARIFKCCQHRLALFGVCRRAACNNTLRTYAPLTADQAKSPAACIVLGQPDGQWWVRAITKVSF